MISCLQLHWQDIDLVTRRPYDSYPAHKLARLVSLEKATLPGGFFLSEQQSNTGMRLASTHARTATQP